MTKKRLPDAFDKEKNFPAIRLFDDVRSPLESYRPVQYFKMGKLRIMFAPEHEDMPLMMSVSHPSRLPTWDELVWIRYKLAPNDVDMAFLLPRLEEYINHDAGRAKYTFTMEAVMRGVVKPEKKD